MLSCERRREKGKRERERERGNGYYIILLQTIYTHTAVGMIKGKEISSVGIYSLWM